MISKPSIDRVENEQPTVMKQAYLYRSADMLSENSHEIFHLSTAMYSPKIS